MALKRHKAEMEIKRESLEIKKEIAKIYADAQTRQIESFAQVMERIVDVLDRRKAHTTEEAHAAKGGNTAEGD